jgi:hypothetical protein
LKSQIEYQVFDPSGAKFFDLNGAIIGVSDNQQTFQVLDRLKSSGRRLDPMAASLGAFREGRDVNARAVGFSARVRSG